MTVGLRQRSPDDELGALESNLERVEDPAQQSERGGVVARDERRDLLDPGGARVGDQLAGQRRPDPAPLELVRDLEGDLGAVAIADEPRDRDRPRITGEVGDERVAVGIDRGELLQVGFGEARLRAVKAGAA